MASTDFTIRILGDSSKAIETVEGFTKKLNTGTQKWSAASAVAAGAVGGAVAAIANRAMDALGGLISESVTASDATDKFGQTLNFAGLDTSTIDKAMDRAQSYADATVYDLGTIQNTTAQLAANGITNFSDLTEAAGNLNAVAGGNADTFKSVSMVLTQTAGNGKLTTENWNQLADAIPGASGRLQEALAAAGAYTGNFRDAMTKGEITADEFNSALLTLGSEPVAVEAATSTDTLEGALGNLQATIVGKLSGAITSIKPMLTGAISGFAELIGWVTENSWVFAVVAGVLTAVLAPAMIAWAASIWATTVALLANPVVWITLAIIALIAAVILLVQNWDQVVSWVTDIWSGFMSWITAGITGFIGWWNSSWTAIGQFVANAWNKWIVNPIRTAWNWVQKTVRDGLNNIDRAWSTTWSGLGSIVRNVFNGVLGWIEGGINGAINLINGMIRGVNVIGGAIGIHLDLIPKVHLPRLATGGVTTGPMMAIIGDNPGGREYVEPVDDVAARLERVALAAAGNARGGNGPTRMDPDDIRDLARAIGEVVYPLIIKGSQKTLATALGG